MGANIVRRIMCDGHEIIAFDRAPAAIAILARESATGANPREEVVAKLAAARIFWSTSAMRRQAAIINQTPKSGPSTCRANSATNPVDIS